MGNKLQAKDYFNLDPIKFEIEDLTLCCLDLASIVNQPIDEEGTSLNHFRGASFCSFLFPFLYLLYPPQ